MDVIAVTDDTSCDQLKEELMFPTIETGRRRPLIRLTVRLIDIYREICRVS